MLAPITMINVIEASSFICVHSLLIQTPRRHPAFTSSSLELKVKGSSLGAWWHKSHAYSVVVFKSSTNVIHGSKSRPPSNRLTAKSDKP